MDQHARPSSSVNPDGFEEVKSYFAQSGIHSHILFMNEEEMLFIPYTGGFVISLGFDFPATHSSFQVREQKQNKLND